MTHRLATNYAKNYCNRTPTVKVIAENVVTCFLGHSVDSRQSKNERESHVHDVSESLFMPHVAESK